MKNTLINKSLKSNWSEMSYSKTINPLPQAFISELSNSRHFAHQVVAKVASIFISY